MNIALANWFIDNCIKGFVFAAFVAATKFFVDGEHIGNHAFIAWWIAAIVLVTVTRILDALHRANLIMEAMNKHDN
jgi:hypothetical protein